jgi:hypothetical protein
MSTMKAELPGNQLPCGIAVLAGFFGLGAFVGAIGLLRAVVGGSGLSSILGGKSFKQQSDAHPWRMPSFLKPHRP